MANGTLLALAADIVAAHVSHNKIAADDLPVLITSVYGTLASLGETPAPVHATREPAVSIRTSVKPAAIACLECGVKMKMLKRHLATDHRLTPADYRVRWGLGSDYPMVAPDYAAKRRELAMQIGLGRKPAAQPAKGKAPAGKPGRKKLGVKFEDAAPSEE